MSDRLKKLNEDKEVVLHISTLSFDLKEQIISYYEREISAEEYKNNFNGGKVNG